MCETPLQFPVQPGPAPTVAASRGIDQDIEDLFLQMKEGRKGKSERKKRKEKERGKKSTDIGLLSKT